MRDSRDVVEADARSPTGHVLDRMREGDLLRVLEIERACFPDPWSRASFVHEIRENPYAENYVMRSSRAPGQIDAYACVWFIDDEVQINNIAVAPSARRRGLGKWLMRAIIREGSRRRCRAATLQVRPSNAPALALYSSLGFVSVGRRRNYYSTTGEDAIVMSLALGPKAGSPGAG